MSERRTVAEQDAWCGRCGFEYESRQHANRCGSGGWIRTLRGWTSRGFLPVSSDEQERHGWQITRGVDCVSCPTCAFTFDAAHEDEGGGKYTCPICNPEAV